jgi:hypothetical protein
MHNVAWIVEMKVFAEPNVDYTLKSVVDWDELETDAFHCYKQKFKIWTALLQPPYNSIKNGLCNRVEEPLDTVVIATRPTAELYSLNGYVCDVASCLLLKNLKKVHDSITTV